jgi:hypothetical protein
MHCTAFGRNNIQNYHRALYTNQHVLPKHGLTQSQPSLLNPWMGVLQQRIIKNFHLMQGVSKMQLVILVFDYVT